MSGAPTLTDVATAAGVSPATASRVLSGSVRVTTSTRRRVNEAVARLGYVRRRAMYTLDRMRTRQVVAAAICEPLPRVLTNPAHLRLLGTCEEALSERGSSLVVVPSTGAMAVQSLLTGAYGGVLLIGAADQQPVAVALAASGVPVRSAGRPPEGAAVPYVDVDNADGARQAARHLLRSGRQRIGVIAGPRGMPTAQDRLDGFVRTLREAGIEDIPVAHGDFSHASGTHAMRWLLDRSPHLDAVFAIADTMAAGALQALRRTGRRVPDDVAAVGFDDAHFAKHLDPPLTTVRQPVEELALRATTLLLSDMTGHACDDDGRPLPTELVVRHSA
ncbi:LacI family transcriptional regulator [Actinobacteria bacterium YIM 96077]|uniref:LacI family transcriptional regulator n=1 Tax=Phytoactinopolyspora halophila TaxID=1981511 RepID=A0A329R0Q9_9ACTN|nr:LacI family DNA-binding transcriptional regulator [Phytoactinopolyspora halophila]AYY11564.1 LacI family transcriptional regulator [Actinobacteria bacterium YIM 96077]RAW17953.1 LacI family transcriptional regulator [Phytoactinopolyspora halophila]